MPPQSNFSSNYRFTDLGFDGIPAAINPFGQVVGMLFDDPGDGFLWTPSTPSGSGGDLCRLSHLTGQPCTPNAINTRGQIVGICGTELGPGEQFLWSPFSPNGSEGSMATFMKAWGSPSAINTLGAIVGVFDAQPPHGYLWKPTAPNGPSGSMVEIGSWVHDINPHGQCVGVSDPGGKGFLWTPSVPNGLTGTMVGLGASPHAVNAPGQVVGERAGKSAHAVNAILWSPAVPNASNGTLVDLGTGGGTNSTAYSLDIGGQTVGEYWGPDGTTHGFLWSPTALNGAAGSMLDLRELLPPGWEIFLPAMNAGGQIVAAGRDASGRQRTVLLTPN